MSSHGDGHDTSVDSAAHHGVNATPAGELPSTTLSSSHAVRPIPRCRTYMDVFLTEEYRKFKLLPPRDPTEVTAYNRMQSVTRFFQEGCLVKSAVMGIGGGVLGLLFGTFMFTMKPMDVETSLPLCQQLRQSYRGFGTEVMKNVNSFAKIGFLYSLIDCGVARTRAKQDMQTALYAGCLTGAALAWKGGPSSMVAGCAGFGVFSALMEKWNPLAPPRDDS